MEKRAIYKSLLILLPVLAVGLATTTDSVMVFDSVAGTTDYYSYFDILPYGEFQLLPPLAALLSGLSGILAVIYLIFKNKGTLKASSIVALISAALAVLPIIRTGDVRVIPNVGLPIFMICQYVLAYYLAKNADKLEKERNAPRLSRKA